MASGIERPGRLKRALVETAEDMRSVGLLGDEAFEKISMRHLGPEERSGIEILSGEEVRRLRRKARMSQAVFAHILNVSPGYVSQLERGTKRPTGAVLALLDVIRRKGIEAIL